MLRRWLININNGLVRRRCRVGVAPKNLLLLAPHCLQSSGCDRRVTADPAECRRCGRCPITTLAALGCEYGITFRVAAGGRQALECLRLPGVKAVVAVACEQELLAGIRSAFPQPVLAVPNQRPQGPCRDTTVDPDTVRAAIEMLLAPLDPQLRKNRLKTRCRASNKAWWRRIRAAANVKRVSLQEKPASLRGRCLRGKGHCINKRLKAITSMPNIRPSKLS